MVKLARPGPVHAVSVEVGKAFFINRNQHNFFIGIFLLEITKLVIQYEPVQGIEHSRRKTQGPDQKKTEGQQGQAYIFAEIENISLVTELRM